MPESSQSKDWTPPQGTKQMQSRAQKIPRVRETKRDELVEKFGGRRNKWRKMKTWDEHDNEWHYYWNPDVGRVGMKPKGVLDPF
ncbi:hypothetical protein HYR99_07615 [Candidatus Poribacteria bacterium]|nr:hypothetical protein [Candidatus Poribacteria bacterium]